MAEKTSTNQNALVIIFMSVVLAGGAVMALVIPAGEFPPQFYQRLEMGLDALLVILLAILVATLGKSPTGILRSAATILGPIGVVAGLVKLGIRFTSDHAWWTGNYLPPVFN